MVNWRLKLYFFLILHCNVLIMLWWWALLCFTNLGLHVPRWDLVACIVEPVSFILFLFSALIKHTLRVHFYQALINCLSHVLCCWVLILFVCWYADGMDTAASTSLYPFHRSKTIHLVCANFALYVYNIVEICVHLKLGRTMHDGIYVKFRILNTGEACSGYSQCRRREEPWCLLVLWSFWCTSYPTWLAAGTLPILCCFIISLSSWEVLINEN